MTTQIPQMSVPPGPPPGPQPGLPPGLPPGNPPPPGYPLPAVRPPVDFWPRGAWRPDKTSLAPRYLSAAALAAGAVAALTLQISVISIGYVLTGTAIAAVAFATRKVRPTAAQWAAIGSALALLAVLAVRDSGWLAVLCVMLSWIVGSFALVGGRTWTGMTFAAFAVWFTPLRVVRWMRRGARRWPLGTGSGGTAGGKSGGTFSIGRLLMVVGVSLVLLLVFGSLFAAADPEFARLLTRATPSLDVPNPFGRLFVGLLVAAVALGSAYLLRRTPRFDAFAPKPGRPVALWEWALPLALLDLLFLAFVAVQVTSLFGGREHVMTTDNLTWAEHARQGFWQLLAVTALTLLVIAVAVRKAARTQRRDRVLVRILLGALCALSLVIVASAVRRMALYENEFGFTTLRFTVMVVELWLGLVFVMLIGAGVSLSARWLPRAVLASAVLGVLAMAVINPDAYVADRSVERFTATGEIDVRYLRTLSYDAVPALDRLPAEERSCALERMDRRLRNSGDDSWYEYNAARERAREILAERPAGSCEDRYSSR